MRSTANAYAELEIDLGRVGASAYQVELRFTDPEPGGGTERDEGEKPRARALAALEPSELLALQQDAEAYGKALAEQLLGEVEVAELWDRAHAVAESRGLFLRLRLRIDPSAAELHALRWELLRDPRTGEAIATSEQTPFSRFMVSSDWRPVRLRRRTGLKALVAVAAPSNLAKYRLAEVDARREIERAGAALQGIGVDTLGGGEPLTFERLVARLRQGVDVLYLVCHGALIRGVPRLYLQDEGGEVAVAGGDELARRIAELPEAPRLVVLASCESAAPGRVAASDLEPAAETALAPRLAGAGVPAILAMQGKISMATVEKAMPIFFAELLRDGRIDRALAVARGAVRERPDAWMPALFLRLKRGLIWYVPGFGDAEEDFAKWKSITSSVRRGSFIPIVGTDVAEHVFGPAEELGTRLAERHRLPVAPHERGDLTLVTQVLSVDESHEYARDQVLRQLRRQLLERCPDLAGVSRTSLPRLLDEVVARQQESDPFHILAHLPASIFITSAFDPLLLKSLKAAGRRPAPLLCKWRSTEDNHPREPSYDGRPSVQEPILYHVFGVLGKPSSLVLTEDDFFDYLLALAEYKLIPKAVRGRIIRNSLLFLGFRLDFWKFRVLFRLITTLGGSRQLLDFAHVGVQVDPEEHTLAEVEGARKYLEQHYGGGEAPPISIYWGRAADFLEELRAQLEKTAGAEEAAPLEDDEDDWLS